METRVLLRKLRTSLLLVFIIQGLMFCVPPQPVDTETETGGSQQSREDSLRKVTCERYLSFAHSYYSNQNWSSAIKNFAQLADRGCEEEFAGDLFYFWGKAYLNISQPDSALLIFQRGLRYLPDDIYLHKNIAYIYKLNGNLEGEITTLEKIAELQPENLENWQELAKLYFKANRFQDQLWAVNKILEIDPDNTQANQDRILIYERMGKDPIDILKGQWENNPDNIRYGLDYARALYDRSDYPGVAETCRQILMKDPQNVTALQLMAESYEYTDQYSKAIAAYTKLYELNRSDINTIAKIVEGYLTLSDFKMALQWAEKAVQVKKTALSYKLRGKVFYEAAQQCSGQGGGDQVSFSDKLVYLMAYEDYLQARKLGDKTLNQRIDYLKEYYIPTQGDWFMQDASKKYYSPEGTCYSWIERKIMNPFAK